MRENGVLLHITSLPSNYGIGTLGEAAYDFVDFLFDSKQKNWQVLPINPTSYGDSPYQSFSVFAINPYFIDLDLLCDQGYLKKEDMEKLPWFLDYDSSRFVDYERIYNLRFDVLKKAFNNSFDLLSEEIDEFVKNESFWLIDYANYMAVKDIQGKKPWQEWDKKLKIGTLYLENAMDFYVWQQYIAYKQWMELKEYANSKDVKIIGDMPIYVALDSADTYTNRDMFLIDEDGVPTKIAGCPPDGFTADGQMWGNPLYNWDYLKKDNYRWWVKRVKKALALFDIVRIDHFRGFDEYYAIPYGDKNAKNGKWEIGPNIELFNVIKEKLGSDIKIIAEDLGYITDTVRKLLDDTGFPGMFVLQFAFAPDAKSYHLPHNCTKNSCFYTGTHDNETTLGWLENSSKSEVDYCKKYLDFTDIKDGVDKFIRMVMSSASDLSIITMQDFLKLPSTARMNTPSTLGTNWKWRLQKKDLTENLSEKIAMLTQIYDRLGEKAIEIEELDKNNIVKECDKKCKIVE